MLARSHAVRPRRAVALLALVTVALLATPVASDAAELLERGSRGPAVVELQRALGIPADGVFGPQTARAVRRYQRRHDLLVDGMVGPQTAAALGLGPVSVAPARRARRAVRLLAVLERIAQCESGGNPRAVSADGRYRGKYQFSRATWRAMGGSGDPARTPEAEQDRRALALLRASGTAPWANCA